MLRPCLRCGEPASGTYCPACRPPESKPSARARGYDANWDKLSARARRLQPFCTDCGSTRDLQLDHTPDAWARKAAGKSIRLRDVAVCCADCNRARGAARGGSARAGLEDDQEPWGDTPPPTRTGPLSKAKFQSHIVDGEA